MFTESKLKANNVRALSWQDDVLVDWVSGGVRYSMDGTVEPATVNYAYSFDSAAISPSGSHVFLYTKNQTKGLLLRNGEIIREINRSFYQAHVYDFPAVFARLPGGSEILIHCPNEYCRLDVEDVLTGKLLSASSERSPSDFFHSRLQVSPSGKWLLSAGWVWHPLDAIGLFDLSVCMNDPTILDNPGASPPGLWEISSAAFLSDDLVFVSSSSEFLGDEDNPTDNRPGSYMIALWSIESNEYISAVSCNKPAGELMPISKRYVVSFYENPRLWDLSSGEMIHEWSSIDSGDQKNSITFGKKPPAIALDRINKRFAVAGKNEIDVVIFQ